MSHPTTGTSNSTATSSNYSRKLSKVVFVISCILFVAINHPYFRVQKISLVDEQRKLEITKQKTINGKCPTTTSSNWIPSAVSNQSCVELPRASKLSCLQKPTNFEGHWSVQRHPSNPAAVKAWNWNTARNDVNTSSSSSHHDNNAIEVPNMPPFTHFSLGSLLEASNTSVVMYGSSHLRELYFAMIRMARGQKFDAPLETTVMRVGSAPFGYPETDACGKSPYAFDKRSGIDLEACGEPGKRLVPELSSWNNNSSNNNHHHHNNNVAIGFKTFLHTPDAEDLFLQFLETHALRHPSVLVVDIGVWGNRGPIMSSNPRFQRTQSVMQPLEEVEYYLQWITGNFPESRIVFVYDKGLGSIDLEPMILPRIYDIVHQRRQQMLQSDKKQQKPLPLIIRKDLIQMNRPEGMPCAHGCGGPVTMVCASLIFKLLSEMISCQLDDDSASAITV